MKKQYTEFENFFYYGTRILNGLIGLSLISTFFIPIYNPEQWRTILFVVFVLMIFFNILTRRK